MGIRERLKRNQRRIADHLAASMMLVGIGLAGWTYQVAWGWEAPLGAFLAYMLFQGVAVVIPLLGEEN